MFNYLHNGEIHTDTGEAYMKSLGMSDDVIDSVLNQKEYESTRWIKLRADAYRIESDPLLNEYMYDNTEAAKKKWRDKVAEIKARFPKQ